MPRIVVAGERSRRLRERHSKPPEDSPVVRLRDTVYAVTSRNTVATLWHWLNAKIKRSPSSMTNSFSDAFNSLLNDNAPNTYMHVNTRIARVILDRAVRVFVGTAAGVGIKDNQDLRYTWSNALLGGSDTAGIIEIFSRAMTTLNAIHKSDYSFSGITAALTRPVKDAFSIHTAFVSSSSPNPYAPDYVFPDTFLSSKKRQDTHYKVDGAADTVSRDMRFVSAAIVNAELVATGRARSMRDMYRPKPLPKKLAAGVGTYNGLIREQSGRLFEYTKYHLLPVNVKNQGFVLYRELFFMCLDVLFNILLFIRSLLLEVAYIEIPARSPIPGHISTSLPVPYREECPLPYLGVNTRYICYDSTRPTYREHQSPDGIGITARLVNRYGFPLEDSDDWSRYDAHSCLLRCVSLMSALEDLFLTCYPFFPPRRVTAPSKEDKRIIRETSVVYNDPAIRSPNEWLIPIGTQMPILETVSQVAVDALRKEIREPVHYFNKKYRVGAEGTLPHLDPTRCVSRVKPLRLKRSPSKIANVCKESGNEQS